MSNQNNTIKSKKKDSDISCGHLLVASAALRKLVVDGGCYECGGTIKGETKAPLHPEYGRNFAFKEDLLTCELCNEKIEWQSITTPYDKDW